MRRLALFLVPLTLAACQRQAQNAAPAPAPVAPAPVASAPATAEPVATPAAPAAKPSPEKPPAMPPKADLPATPPKAAADYRSDLNLTGTEPFWGVQIRKDRITLSRPDHPDISAPNPGPKVSGETARWDAGEMTITLRPQRWCSDGMSDRQYPYAAEVKVGNEVLKGCAYNPAKTPRMPH
ncbi:MAG: COG3650 family protein [Ignavibacteriales bacterium]